MSAATLKSFTCWEIAHDVVSTRPRVLLHGVPGTGKTYAATTLGVKPDQNVYSITVTPETPAAELRGMYIPKGDHFDWVDGPAVAAWRTGGRLVLNEIDRATGDLLSLMLAVCDDPGFARLTLPTGETVRPAPGFSVVATMNGEPDDLDFALLDRFAVRVKIDRIAPGAMDKLPADRRDAATKSVAHSEPARRVSYRGWSEFAELRGVVGFDKAMLAVFGSRAQDIANAFAIARA